MNSLSTQLDVKAGFLGTRSTRNLVAFVVAGVVGACATIGPPASPEEAVKARAQKRWDLLVKGNLLEAYEFYSPGSRVGFSREDFIVSVRRGFLQAAKVEKVTCSSADSCEADVAVEYEFRGIRNTSPVKESWVRDGREWWYLRK